MKRLLYFLILGFFLSSCATLFNRKNVSFYVRSNPGAVYVQRGAGIVQLLDRTRKKRKLIALPADGQQLTIPQRRGGLTVWAPRGKNRDLEICVSRGGKEKTVRIKPIHSWKYYLNVLNLGIGFWVDRNNPRRFSYPPKIFIDLNDTIPNEWYIYRPPATQGIDVTIQPLNIFALETHSKLKSIATPIGFAADINHRYGKRGFVSLDAGAAGIFIPGGDFIPGGHDTLQSQYAWWVAVRNNHTWGRLDAGYGLSLGRHSGFIYETDSLTKLYHYKDFDIGASFSCHYRLGRFLYAGITWQPQFLTIRNGVQFQFEQVVNFGLAMRFYRARAK